MTKRPLSWWDVLKREKPLLLPVAHDALTARMIEQAGFAAYQIGGFAVIGARFGLPDIDLTHFAEKTALVESISKATTLPALVDCDDGYGDAKNVTHTVATFAERGIPAIFIEDQQAPKRCGHMSGKKVVPTADMVQKVRAAAAAKRGTNLFFLARTDAVEPNGLEDAIERGKRYLGAGADGIYVEGLADLAQLERTGQAFHDVPLATTILERGGKTPCLPPEDLRALGFDMLLYPTTVIFRAAWAIRQSLQDLKAGRPLDPAHSLDMESFEKIVDLQYWSDIETRFPPES